MRKSIHILLFLSLSLSIHLYLPISSECVYVVFLRRRLIQLLMLISLFVLLPLIFFLVPFESAHSFSHVRRYVCLFAYFSFTKLMMYNMDGNFLPVFYAVASSALLFSEIFARNEKSTKHLNVCCSSSSHYLRRRCSHYNNGNSTINTQPDCQVARVEKYE